MKRTRIASTLAAAVALLAFACTCGRADPPAAAGDWPQWHGPNRDGIAVDSPKLLDTWPKDGPSVLWKSDWIPGCDEGGCGSPVVADGKLYLYVNWKHPVGGGDTYHIITTELLKDWGWSGDMPDDLAKKIEAAWSSKDRPSSFGWNWWEIDWAKEPRDKELDEFLGKHPELDKYIKDFIATLTPEEAKKYGDHIKRRLCMCTERDRRWGIAPGLPWEQLVKLSALRDVGHQSYHEWADEFGKRGIATPGLQPRQNESFRCYEWDRAFTMTDTLVCLDGATGKLIWKKEFPEDRDRYVGDFADLHAGHFGQIGASGTPTISNGKCYVAGAMGLYCFSAKDGALLWQVKGAPTHASVLVANGVVNYWGAGYNAETGALLWRDPKWEKLEKDFLECVCGRSHGFSRSQELLGSARNSSPQLWASGGRNCIISSDGRGSTCCCFDLETGKILWTVKGLCSTISGDILICGGQSYKMTLSGVEPLCKNPLKPVGLNGMSIVHQGYLYTIIDKAEFQPLWINCSDLKTGEAKWEDKTKAPGAEGQLAGPILADGKLIIPWNNCHGGSFRMSGNDFIEMVKASPDEKYVSLGMFNPKYLCPFTSPALAGGKLYLRLRTGVACYDLRSK